MVSTVQDVLFAALERAMRERSWTCPRCRHAAHPALHARDIILRCSNTQCNHLHEISEQSLLKALREADVLCPRCHAFLTPDHQNHGVCCSRSPGCRHKESWRSLLPRHVSFRTHTDPARQSEKPGTWEPGRPGVRKRPRRTDAPGLAPPVIAETLQRVLEKQQSDLVANHSFQVRVAIQEMGSTWKTSVSIVPREERGTGILVDVRALLFFDRASTRSAIQAKLEEWSAAIHA